VTHLRCDGIFNHALVAELLLNLTIKEF